MTERHFRDTEVYLLHKLVIRIDQYARDHVLGNAGITYAEFLVLMAAADVAVPVQENLCQYLDQSKSLISQRIAALKTKGLLRQEERPENRRQTLVFLTPAGGEVLARVTGLLSRAGDSLFEGWGAGRDGFRDQLLTLVRQMEASDSALRTPPASTKLGA